jgi:hypothetical protein
VYEVWKAANGGAEPPNPRQFFGDTLENNYGLQDLEHKYWDTWNALKQGTQHIVEYNIEFQQALTDLLAQSRMSNEDREISLGSSARSARVVQNVSIGCPVG